MQKVTLLMMDLNTAFSQGIYQQKIIRLCKRQNILYGFTTTGSYQDCLYPINVLNKFTPHFLFTHTGTELYQYTPGGEYQLDNRFGLLVAADWPGNHTLINALQILEDCRLVSRGNYYLAYQLEGIITRNVADYILSGFPVQTRISNQGYLEILPRQAGDRLCLQFLAEHFQLSPVTVVTCCSPGLNSGEDFPFFRLIISKFFENPDPAQADNNRQYRATSPGSRGIWEGLCELLGILNPKWAFTGTL